MEVADVDVIGPALGQLHAHQVFYAQFLAVDSLRRDAALVFVAGHVKVVWLLVQQLRQAVYGHGGVDEVLVQCELNLAFLLTLELLVLLARVRDRYLVVLRARLEHRQTAPHRLVHLLALQLVVRTVDGQAAAVSNPSTVKPFYSLRLS